MNDHFVTKEGANWNIARSDTRDIEILKFVGFSIFLMVFKDETGALAGF